MAVNLSPVGGVAAQFFTNSGYVLTGGKLYTYSAGTTTPATTYTNSQGNIAWTNPIVLDAAGRVPGSGEIWLVDGANYKFVLKDSNDVLIATYDNISGINSNYIAYTNEQEIQTATAGQTVFTLTTMNYLPATNSLSVFVDGVNQYGPGAQYSYVETDANTVTFNAGLHVGAEVKFTSTQQQGAGAVDASQVSYDPPFTGSVVTNVEAKLAQTVSVKDFGAVGDGITNDTAAIQKALDSGAGTIEIPKGNYKSGALIVSNDNVCLVLDSNASIVFYTLGDTVYGITVDADNFSIKNGKLEGPSAGYYVNEEIGVYMAGSSTSARKTGLTIIGTEITGFGSYGIKTQFLDNIKIENCDIHDNGYMGAGFLSSNGGQFVNNTVKTIGPGTGSNMYGVSLTHISTGYNTDPNKGTKQATNPFCWDWYIAGNTIDDIAWEGIDAHGAYETTVIGNRVFNTKNGISVASGSGDASGYAGWDNVIIGNIVDARNYDGTTSGRENLGPGILVNGGSTLKQARVVIEGNTLVYKGVLGSSTSGAISAQATYNSIVSNNTIEYWGGSGIHYGNSDNAAVTGNQIGGLGGTAAGTEYAIHTDTADTSYSTITNNVIYQGAGISPRIGFRGPVIVNLPYFEGNDFRNVTSGQYDLSANFLVGSEGRPSYLVTVNNPGTGETISLTPMARYKDFILRISSNDAASVITNLINGAIGQQVSMYSPAATAWTFNRDHARLPGGTNFIASRYDMLTVVLIGTEWIALSSAVNA